MSHLILEGICCKSHIKALSLEQYQKNIVIYKSGAVNEESDDLTLLFFNVILKADRFIIFEMN